MNIQLVVGQDVLELKEENIIMNTTKWQQIQMD